MAPDPVFIVGHYRSGTTHLHNLLSLDKRLSFPALTECSAPQYCLLTRRIEAYLASQSGYRRKRARGLAAGLGCGSGGVGSAVRAVGLHDQLMGRLMATRMLPLEVDLPQLSQACQALFHDCPRTL